MLLVAFVAFTHAQIGPPRKPNPMFPGHGPFNPHQPKPWGGRRGVIRKFIVIQNVLLFQRIFQF